MPDSPTKGRGVCPVCEGYGGGETPEGHEDDPGCIGSCPKCWCPGCHDGHDYTGPPLAEDPRGSREAYDQVREAKKLRKERWTLDQIKYAVDQMVCEDDYSPDDAQVRIEEILTELRGDNA